MPFFDTHVHLQDPRLASCLNEALSRARSAGVERMVCCGTCEADWESVADLARRFPGRIVPAFGLHPMEIAGRTAGWMDALNRKLDEWPGAAIGEIGLDRMLESRDDSAQADVFRAQLELSRSRRRPALIHARKAVEPLFSMLREAGPHPAGFVLHAFGGPADRIPAFVALNALFSFSGAITWSKARRLHDAVRAVPEDRILLETDAPFIRIARDPDEPETLPEPADVAVVARAAARLRGESEEQLIRMTWARSRFLGHIAETSL